MEDENFPWGEYYFIARVLLHLTDEEFWKLNPCKLMALFKVYNQAKTNASKENEAKNNVQNAKDLQKLLNI